MANSATAGAAARRARNRQEMRAVILDAARSIVAERGAEALTMRAIGQTIGYSAAALYEYFPAKEDLFGCLYFEGSGGLSGRMRKTLEGMPERVSAGDRLFALGHAYRGFAHEQPDLFRMVFDRPAPAFTPGFDPRPTGGPGKEEIEPGDDAFGLLIEVVRDGIVRGELEAVPPLPLALAAWAAVHGFVMLELNGHLTHDGPPSMRAAAAAGDVPTPDDLFATTLRLCFGGVLRR